MKKLGAIIDNLKKGEEAPTRHHNPYLKAALSLDHYLHTEKELSLKKDALFENENKHMVIEIGCYMGKNIQEFAQQNPTLNFVGLDITYKRVVKSAKKLDRLKLNNAKIALCDGKRFLEEFTPANSLAGVCVFFPDPWPKDRHEKNRLLKQDFINLLKEKLQPEGFFWFKTDALNYFQQTEKLLLETGFKRETLPTNLDNNTYKPKILQGGPYETAFQKIFAQKQIPFYQEVYVK